MQWRWVQTSIRCQSELHSSWHSLHDPTNLLSRSVKPAGLTRDFHASRRQNQEGSALRKELKEEKKATRTARRVEGVAENVNKDARGDWRLTVGIEIHAQLNTARKLFSGTQASCI